MTQLDDNTAPAPCGASDRLDIKDHFELFQTDTYQDLFAYKRQFEGAPSPEEIAASASGPNLGTTAKRTSPAKP